MRLSDKQNAILDILADGQFHSGADLAARLNISRTAIWKQLNALTDFNIRFSAVNGKGYRLDFPLERLNQDAIFSYLEERTLPLVNSLEIFDQIASTNSYLLQRAQENAPTGTVCFAEQQTAGKGRRGRQWVSPFGHNIYLSILWRFQASPLAISGLSLAIGIAVVRTLRSLYTAPFQLKWPNDIYFDGKKLGGILIEVSGESEGPCFAIIGLGLNIFLPKSETKTITQPWTDLTQITGTPAIGRNALAGDLLNHLLAVITEFEKNGLSSFSGEWRKYDSLKDKPVTLYLGQRSYQGIVQGINDNGLLLLSLPNGTTQAFASGEVTFNPMP